MATLTTIKGIQRDKTDWRGGAQRPPRHAAIISIVVIIVDGGVVADNQRPPPHASGRWPADNVAIVLVGFPPVIRSPAQPLPILRIIVFVVVVVFVVIAVIVVQALPVVFPPSPPPPPPILLSSAIELPDCSLDSFPRNASVNPSRSLDMYDPLSTHAGCQSQGRPYQW